MTRDYGRRRVLVTGGRDYTDRCTIYQKLDALHADIGIAVIVTGGCPTGADAIANDWSWFRLNRPAETYPASFDTFGKPAGPIRNGWVVRNVRVDLVFAFPGNTGTADTLTQAEREGVRCLLALDYNPNPSRDRAVQRGAI